MEAVDDGCYLRIVMGLTLDALTGLPFPAAAASESVEWWRVAAGILAVPAAVLGLVYSYLQIRKLRLDTTQTKRELRSGEARVSCRYLIGKSFDVIAEISRGELERLPVDGALLAGSLPGSFLRSLLANYPDGDRRDEVAGEGFGSFDDYAASHPGIPVAERPDSFPYFNAVRIPSIEELRERLGGRDPLSGMLLDGGVPAAEIAYAGLARTCGSGKEFQETYRLRQLWAVYLQITNGSGEPVVLESLVSAEELPDGLGYRPLRVGTAVTEASHRLPHAEVAAQGSVVVPLAAMLAPLRLDFRTSDHEVDYQPDGRWQAISVADLADRVNEISVIGPASWPKLLRFRVGEELKEAEIHSFDPANVYLLDRGWSIGCCPHLFLRGSGSLRYVGELFHRTEGGFQTHSLVVPGDVSELVVAELEDETTFLGEVVVNGRRTVGNTRLEKGDEMRLAVSEGDEVRITGYYVSRHSAAVQPWRRSDLVGRYVCEKSPVA